MLQSLRNASHTWIGRIVLAVVMGVIILSFAIWGIGNIFQGFGQNRLASVGGQEITIPAYREAYQTALQRLQSQTRQGITNEQARLFGIDRQVLAQMLASAAMGQQAQALGLSMSDKQIAAQIAQDPNFSGPSGTFDRARFVELLRDNGFSEKSFVAEQRKVYLLREITGALDGGIVAPRAQLEALNRYDAEARTVDYIVLADKAAGDIPAPTDDQLKTYFEAHKTAYRSPEYRKLLELSVTPPPPERRDIQQIVFADETEAKAAADRLKGGTTFEALAAERKLSPADLDLGLKTRADLADPEVAEAAFALPEGGVSEPLKLAFGAALVRVVKILPQPAIDVGKIHDQIEEARTSGKSLTDAAKAVGLEVRTVDAIDPTGRDPAGGLVSDLTQRDALVKAAFASDVGVDNDTITTPDKGYIWFEVVKVDPAHDRPFDEVKDEVAKAWRGEDVAKRLTEKAAELVKRLEGGDTLQSIAAAEGVEVKTAANVQRAGSGDLAPAVVAQVFKVASGGAGSAPGPDGTRVLFKVTVSSVPPLDVDSQQAKTAAAQYARELAADIGAQYAAKVQADLGVRVNEQALRLAAGGE